MQAVILFGLAMKFKEIKETSRDDYVVSCPTVIITDNFLGKNSGLILIVVGNDLGLTSVL